ncbi:D-alanyl-D-alanine carboxypeptidase/D-alanyl-D-alanine-endopeptidase [Ornithinicoccus halotolerans]|uniref:D-alanyl-D-alanine carboxypeptidase/D-alanyl-D-alanine-endopeptidase n=1 Tax=Ornithinicoccus halotolerans TaxID=1748220 RepID=UPI0012959A26|nr:D-alanyl-D-alanine carboxypeptidase [Ornithinicoccus halotolerans]
MDRARPLLRTALLTLVLLLAPASAPVAAGAGTGDDPGSLVARQAAVRPRVTPVPPAVLTPVAEGQPVDPAAVRKRLSDELDSRWLGRRTSLVVRDALTGDMVLQQAPDRPVTPASLTKLLTAAAVATSFPLQDGFATRAVAGKDNEVFLVAGGDTLLARGEGDAAAVAGRAGLADLAGQVASELGRDSGPVRLRVDVTYAGGPPRARGWTDFWLENGYTGPITMLGLAEDRAFPGQPAPANPARAAVDAFADALQEAGVRVADRPVQRGRAPAGGRELGAIESAPARDVLALALTESDNALVEQLARQAAVAAGAGAKPAEVAAWVTKRVGALGIDTTGVSLQDTSGLADGTTVPVRVVGEVLVAAASGQHPGLQAVTGSLPIAGYTGTLWDRFHLDVHGPAVGVARAKTGTLPGVTALGGLVTTADDRLLAFTVVADRIGRDGAVLEARSVLDQIVAELARCGCGPTGT